MKNILTGELRAVSVETGLTVGQPAMSGYGGYVVFGTSRQLDSRYQSSGIFSIFTAISKCRFCPLN
ncbi:MAG: hypothetical protein ACRD6X_05195 [Pyrinomonadaceae bacterium]